MKDLKSTDKRIIRTRSRLKTALTKLLLQKKLEDISVIELVREAGINRSTFYLHFDDIEDLYLNIEEELGTGIVNILCSSDENGQISGVYNILSDIILFLFNNRELCLALVKADNKLFFDTLIKAVEPTLSKRLEIIIESASVRHFFIVFFGTGTHRLIIEWLNTSESPREDMAALLEQLYVNCLNSFTNPRFENKKKIK